jgi:hypothetical protein
MIEQMPLTPEEIKKSQKAYEKNNKKLASELNPSIMEVVSGYNRLQDYGHYTGDRIAENEAEKENQHRDELAKIREEIASYDEGIEKDKLIEKEQELSERLNKEQNSSLYLKEKVPFPETNKPFSYELNGVINGKKVEIKMSPSKNWDESNHDWYMISPEDTPDYIDFEGTVDGKEVSREEAIKIFNEYRGLATTREDWWM